MKKINWKRLKWAIKEELGILLIIAAMFVLIAIPWVLILLTDSRWWILLYPIAFFVGGVYEKYEGR
jgi:hypothetical protein